MAKRQDQLEGTQWSLKPCLLAHLTAMRFWSLAAEEVKVLMLLVPSEVPPVNSLISFIPKLRVDG